MAVVPPVDKRRQRGLRTREALEEAALRLAVDRGYDHTTIDDIAAAAGVSSRTFFRHFATKDDVVLGDQSERLERLAELLAERPGHEPIMTAVREAILGLAGDDERRRDFHLIRSQLIRSAPSIQARASERRIEWEGVIADYVARRLDVGTDGDLRPALVAGATIAALRTAHAQWVESQGNVHLPDLVRTTLELLDAGFGLPTPDG
jgi:AcrR family transcriptional regulator